MLQLKTSLIVTHVIGWVIFFMLPFLLFPMPQGNEGVMRVLTSASYWLSYALYIFLFYFNGYFLIPKFYFPKKYATYFLVAVTLFAAAYFVRQTIEQPPVSVLNSEQIKHVDSLIKNRAFPFQRLDSFARSNERVNLDSIIRNRPPLERPPDSVPLTGCFFTVRLV